LARELKDISLPLFFNIFMSNHHRHNDHYYQFLPAQQIKGVIYCYYFIIIVIFFGYREARKRSKRGWNISRSDCCRVCHRCVCSIRLPLQKVSQSHLAFIRGSRGSGKVDRTLSFRYAGPEEPPEMDACAEKDGREKLSPNVVCVLFCDNRVLNVIVVLDKQQWN